MSDRTNAHPILVFLAISKHPQSTRLSDINSSKHGILLMEGEAYPVPLQHRGHSSVVDAAISMTTISNLLLPSGDQLVYSPLTVTTSPKKCPDLAIISAGASTRSI